MPKLNVRKGIKKGSKSKVKEEPKSTIKDVFSDWKEKPSFEHEDIEPKKENNHLFDILNDIKFGKSGTLLDDEEYEKKFDYWMILRFLSMDDDLTEIVNLISEYQTVLSKKEFYKLLIEVIPKTKTFSKYIKSPTSKKDENVEKVAKFYQCSMKHAREYIDIMGNVWTENVIKSFGGKGK